MILDPVQTTLAHLVWQSPLGGAGSRRRFPVAELRVNPETGEESFRYMKDEDSFLSALEEGFAGYTGIPLGRDDQSDAIKTLGRRLPNPERPDYEKYLNRFGLSRGHNLSTLSLLAYTGAKLTGDSFSVSETFEGFARPFQYLFDVAGRRHYLHETPSPEKGEQVRFVAETDNDYDVHAIVLLDGSGQKFGYINSCQAEKVGSWLSTGSIQGRVYRVNGRESYPRLFVFAEIDPNQLMDVA